MLNALVLKVTSSKIILTAVIADLSCLESNGDSGRNLWDFCSDIPQSSLAPKSWDTMPYNFRAMDDNRQDLKLCGKSREYQLVAQSINRWPIQSKIENEKRHEMKMNALLRATNTRTWEVDQWKQSANEFTKRGRRCRFIWRAQEWSEVFLANQAGGLWALFFR